MILMIDEYLVAEAPGQLGVVLTTHRVRMRMKGFGSDDVVSIMLDVIASCGLVRRSRPGLLLLAALFVLIGLVMSGLGGGVRAGLSFGGINLILLLLAALCVVGYALSRRQYLVVSSAGESIRVQTRGAGAEDLVGFIDAVEAAKNIRYLRYSTP